MASEIHKMARKMGRAFVLGMVFFAAAVVEGATIYENDFSTRRSVGAIPYGGWREGHYETGPLVNVGYANADDAFSQSDLQDNWIKGRNGCNAMATVIDDGGNQSVLTHCENTKTPISHVIAKQRLGNVFTSGVVMVQCDLKPPSNWPEFSSRSTRLLLGDEAFFSPETDPDYYLQYMAGGVGISYNGSAYKYWRYGANVDNSPNAPNRATIWYRVVITANLDSKTYGVAIYDLDSSHPTLDTPTPATAAFTESNINFWSVTKERPLSSISSIGIAGYGVTGTTNVSVRATTAQFDNIRVWHDGALCYENDFTTRRSRSLAAGTTTASYVATCAVTNAYSYAEWDWLTKSKTSANLQPIGKDGWRRLNRGDGCQVNLTVTAYTNNLVGTLDYEGNSGLYGIAAQPLGQVFTNGKIHASVDVRQVALTDTGSVTLFLGGENFYSSGDLYTSNHFARAGIRGEKLGNDSAGLVMRSAYWQTSDNGTGANLKGVRAETGVSTAAKWYRIDIVADLDAHKFDYTVYYVCPGTSAPSANAANGEVLFATNGIWRANAVDSIASIALSCYYGKAHFDNLRIRHTPPGSSTERLVYLNTFATRTVYCLSGPPYEERLIGTMKKDPVGIDGWTRLVRADTDVLIKDDGTNAALGFGHDARSYTTFAAHDIGGLYTSGRLTLSFDMHAPDLWAANAGNVSVWLAGDTYHEGDLTGGDWGYKYWTACGVGFTNASLVAWHGDSTGGGGWVAHGTATAGHWYRFVMKATLANNTSDVSVYDMGTVQPTLATPTPQAAPVMEVAAVPFRRSNTDLGGISCLGIHQLGAKGSILKEDQNILLIDNIRIDHSPAGCIVVFR